MGNEFTEKNFYQSTSKNLNINENIKKKCQNGLLRIYNYFYGFQENFNKLH